MDERCLTQDGKDTTPTDPNRLIFYGMCTYWTDDWDDLDVLPSGIPCCPYCGSPGMQTTAKTWFEGAEKFQAENNPKYVKFLEQSKETCKRPMKYLDWYKQWLQDDARH